MMNYSTALVQLPLVRETQGQRVRTPEDAYRLCLDISGLAQECFQVILLNAKNAVMNRVMVSLGLADSALVHPREVFRSAIHEGATAVVLVHNHPSGETTPSAEDLRITRQLVEAGRIVDIKVMDHIIIGRELQGQAGWLSLRESGLCVFT
jgi:DNA repair protein RadC